MRSSATRTTKKKAAQHVEASREHQKCPPQLQPTAPTRSASRDTTSISAPLHPEGRLKTLRLLSLARWKSELRISSLESTRVPAVARASGTTHPSRTRTKLE